MTLPQPIHSILSCNLSLQFVTKKVNLLLRAFSSVRTVLLGVMLIRSTAHPSYCPSALLPIRPTATSDLRQMFIFVLFEG